RFRPWPPQNKAVTGSQKNREIQSRKQYAYIRYRGVRLVANRLLHQIPDFPRCAVRAALRLGVGFK
ncbi:MAG: hypothetical protein WBE37_24585, partial [Bryobacteraceae bacterium]